MVADNAGANMAHEGHTPNMYKQVKLSVSSHYWNKLRTMRNRVTNYVVYFQTIIL